MNKVENTKEVRRNELEKNEAGLSYAVAFQGSDHVRSNTPCQDYCGFKDLGNGMKVLVISDGHGSVPRSHYGSKFAVETLIELVEDCLAKQFSEMDIVRFFRDSIGRATIIKNWKDKIAQDWKNYNTDPQKMNCTDEVVDMYGATLIFSILLPNFIIAGFVGDGALIFVDKEGKEALAVLSAGDDVGESTTSLSHQRADFIEIKLLSRKDFRFALLSTDGLAKPYGGVMLDIAKNCAKQYQENPEGIQEALYALMETSHPQIGDDISLVFGAFEDTYVKR